MTMRHFLKRKHNSESGFTLIELMVIVSIIGLLSAIIFTQLTSARIKGQNAKRSADKRQVSTALTLYNAAANGLLWPDSGGTWVCLGPASETCWDGTYTGSDTVVTDLQPYLQTLPNNNAYADSYAYNRIIYNSNITIDDRTGAFIVWVQEGVMPQSLCQSSYPVQVLDKYSYCYEYLGR